MKKHILIASDDSDNALRAIIFVGSHMSNDCEVTLFSVVPDTEALCSMQSPELTSYFLEQQSAFCTLEDKKKELLNAALKKGRHHLIDCGFDGKRVTIKLNKIDKGVARDIITEANKPLYDMIMLGKRGHNGIREFFMGNISQKVLHGVQKATVLLVG